MRNWKILLSLCLIYIVFAILLNSVGAVILQVIKTYHVSKPEASTLEGLKDLPIAFVGFILASFLPRLGYKKALIIGTAFVTIMSACMPLLNSFFSVQLLFFVVGCSFGIVKVATYSTIGLLSDSPKSHASITNFIEGVFMLGVLAAYLLFPYFISESDPSSWLQTYWVIAAIGTLAILLITITKLDESEVVPDEDSNLKDDFRVMVGLMKFPLVYIFVISAFIYVFIEQGIGTWLPTFNYEVLNLPNKLAVQFALIYAAALALGRFSASAVLARIHWFPFLTFCLICAGALIYLILPATNNLQIHEDVSWLSAPWQVYILPSIGLFLAPIYPSINSSILSALPKAKHASMTGLIVIFSALGGTTGSVLMSLIFKSYSGKEAFQFLLIPIAVLIITLYFFKRNLASFSLNQD